MVAPAIAMTGITANNTIGIFESLPDYIELNAGHQQNQIVAINPDGSRSRSPRSSTRTAKRSSSIR